MSQQFEIEGWMRSQFGYGCVRQEAVDDAARVVLERRWLVDIGDLFVATALLSRQQFQGLERPRSIQKIAADIRRASSKRKRL